MEKNHAILIADLSGYTALTETHGAASAADLIDKYLEIVNQSLVGTSFLQERVGDEVMVLAEYPDDLLSTVEVLRENLSEENHFLQIHGGMHYGKLLKRGNGFFGTALNATARIAAFSKPGKFMCSDTFRENLQQHSFSKFKAVGTSKFKNLSNEFSLFELIKEKRSDIYIDPICRMIVADINHTHVYEFNQEIRFCSSECLNKYSQNYILQ